MIEVMEQEKLEKLLQVHQKTVAVFYSSYCPFCRSFLPIFKKTAEQNHAYTFVQVKINEDENPIWETYSLKAVPSVIYFENGQLSRRLDCRLGVGLTENQFKSWLEKP
jgi:thioredoxin 1